MGEVLSETEILAAEDREHLLVLTERVETRERLMAAGSVVAFADLVDTFKILPRHFTTP